MRNIRVYLYNPPLGDRQIPFRGLRTKPDHQPEGSSVLRDGIVSSLASCWTGIPCVLGVTGDLTGHRMVHDEMPLGLNNACFTNFNFIYFLKTCLFMGPTFPTFVRFQPDLGSILAPMANCESPKIARKTTRDDNHDQFTSTATTSKPGLNNGPQLD